ncbi:IclR family transcriptional regulator [Microbacterium sp. CPCC 204701]|uniref:IclR family transcriptional regulator n=1 Tax=Microbacterium sp. CPCC 204701 TaxID=2493084 RepID=UPI0013E31922|nr:IclR family transcriptional regulator [Microbacterium sp. CPCC 204701]
MPDPQLYALDSAANALRVVGMLRTRRTITVTEVSHELGVGKSTAHRLLATLVSEGFALRDPVHRKYHPGRALVEAGLSALGEFTRPTGGSGLAALAEHTGYTVKLLVLDGPFARVVEIAEGDEHGRVGGSVGQLLPAHSTAGGKVLLSQENRESLWRRFGGRLELRTDRTISNWAALLTELDLVRDRGWATNDAEATSGVRGLAVPVRGRDQQIVAALAVAGPVEKMVEEDRMQTLRHMFATAYEIQVDSSFG